MVRCGVFYCRCRVSLANQLCDRPLQVGELDGFGEVFGETCGETTFAILFHTEATHGDGEQQPSLLPIQTLQ